MSADPPEIATNEEWRGIMKRAREAHGLSQKELAFKVGTQQAMISQLESGAIGGSQFVLAICEELSIPPPVHFENDDERAWWQAGHLLRRKNMKQYLRALALVEGMLEEEAEEQKPANDADRNPPARK